VYQGVLVFHGVSNYQSFIESAWFLIAGDMQAPSSLAGKALGVFRSKTEQKLRSTCSAFPHDDNTQITNIAEIYIDALGYLRSAFA
jgi:hypothetical protein